VREVRRVAAELPMPAMARGGAKYPLRPLAYQNYYLLQSASLNAASDDYEPVGFSHRIHDGLTEGDCGVCHHRYSSDESDRVGTDIVELHGWMDITIGGACSECHADMASNPPQSCRRCHDRSNEPDAPARLGLKGAYHRQCIGCHESQSKPATAPTACRSCHQAWVPDHALLVSLSGTPSPQDVTRNCLSCHERAGHDLLRTAHWNWKGNSPALAGHEHRTDVGLTLIVNNYCLAIGPNLKQCSACHIGYGSVDTVFDFTNPENIDCLVCHDTTGSYRKNPLKGGMPDPQLDLVAIAQKVGRPSRRTCGSCHFESGGSPNAKHGDLEPSLADADTALDVHMGSLNMRCQACHKTAEHRIAGRSLTAPAVEGVVACGQCHGSRPHGVTGVLSRHLDDHIRAVACETCHIPSFAHTTPTLLRRDYSAAGEDREKTLDENGMLQYEKKFGTLQWGKDVVPTYLWYDGTRKASLLGDKIDPSAPVALNAPVGDRRDPEARIFPFKMHTAVQPYDSQNKVLAAPNFVENYWVDFDWDKAIAAGMKRVGLEYSGQYSFVETRMYSAIHHGVAPAKMALGCADCHASNAIACSRCHDKAARMELPAHRLPVYPEVKDRFDFKALGYQGDPALVGGRFYIEIGRGTPR
ncbi:MAG: tetrathionate reductase family octaheme c-type cytochrome, partial [Acidobacteria bacterium]|nr:tetrathionate reductase family octaheme c-type cytochrome [Acidobacteriota bacterium]